MGENHRTAREDIEETLEDVLRFILTGPHLKRQGFYIVHTCYSYSRDILAVLVGLGLGFPGARIFDSQAHENLGELLVGLPWYEWSPGVLLVVFVAIINVYIARESVEKRAHLVEECGKKLDTTHFDIEEALKERRPLVRLEEIRTNLAEFVKYHAGEKSYTFYKGYAPGADVEAKKQAKELCDSYQNRWK